MLRVEHECEVMTKHEDILLLPERSFFRKALHNFRRLLMASDKNPGARKYLRSRLSIIVEKRRHLRHYKRIIHPFSVFRHCWDIMMILTITCLLLAVPYQASFEMSRHTHYWTVIKNFLLFLCCMDITLNFMTGYFDQMQHAVVMNPKKIMKRYSMHIIFLPSLLGSLPTDVAYIMIWREYIVIRELSSLICGFRVFSLSYYIRNIIHAYDMSLSAYEVYIMIFWSVIALHWLSCLYWFVPIITTSAYLPERPVNDSWLHEFNLWEASKGRQYVFCLFRSISVFFRAGFFYSKPKNETDLTVVIVSQILGCLSLWILTARVMQLFKGVNSSRLSYQITVAQLKKYMRQRQLPHLVQSRIITYYEYRFQHRYFLEYEILNTLSVKMQQEIKMYSCRKLVENVTFFNNLPLSLLTRIVTLLKSEIFLTNDVIVRANQPGNCMYFIATGTVAIYTGSGKEVCHLEDGAHFGEIALVMPDERRIASVIAVDICKLYRLDRADFARTIHPYPMLWEQIKQIAIERHEKTTILNAQ